MSRLRIEGLLASFPKLIEGEQAAAAKAAGLSGGGGAPGGGPAAGGAVGGAGASGVAASTKQHTFVETEHVRYLYLPLEALYVLLVTNKSSNIVEDLSTLRMLSKVRRGAAGRGGGQSCAEKPAASGAAALLERRAQVERN